jgi:hypothetical protein
MALRNITRHVARFVSRDRVMVVQISDVALPPGASKTSILVAMTTGVRGLPVRNNDWSVERHRSLGVPLTSGGVWNCPPASQSGSQCEIVEVKHHLVRRFLRTFLAVDVILFESVSFSTDPRERNADGLRVFRGDREFRDGTEIRGIRERYSRVILKSTKIPLDGR